MAALDPAALPTLGMLVAAATFSTGFLSTRLHRHRDAAVARVRELSDRFDEKRSERPTGAAAWLEEQRRTLEASPLDSVTVLTVGVNLAVVALVTALALFFGSDAEVPFPPQDAAGWGLSAFIAVALLVLGISIADVVRVRADLKERLAATALGAAAVAEDHLRRAIRRRRSSPRRRDELKQAVRLAEQGVKASGGLVALPYATLGCAYLARLDTPGVPADALLLAEQYLARAVELGPATARMSAAWSLVAEQRRDEELAAGRWLKAAEAITRDELDAAPLTEHDAERNLRAVRGRVSLPL